MPRMRFDPTINLGHIFTILALIGSVLLAYTTIMVRLENHELRLHALEEKSARDSRVQEQILNTLTTIREDIAALKARDI